MATSSIFADFSIKDKKTAESFVDALDKSAHFVPDVPQYEPARLVTDPDEIKAIFSHKNGTKA